MTAPVLTPVIGVPSTIPPSKLGTLTGVASYDGPYIGGATGLGLGQTPFKYDTGSSGYVTLDDPAVPLALPLARGDIVGSTGAKGWLLIDLTWQGLDGSRQTKRLTLRPQAGSTQTLDLTIDQAPLGYTTPQSLLDLITRTTTAAARAESVSGLGAETANQIRLAADQANAAAADARTATTDLHTAVAGSEGLKSISLDDSYTTPDGTPVAFGVLNKLKTASPLLIDTLARTWLFEAIIARMGIKPGVNSRYPLLATDKNERVGFGLRTLDDGTPVVMAPGGADVGVLSLRLGNPGSGLPLALTDRSQDQMLVWITNKGEFDVSLLGPNLRKLIGSSGATVPLRNTLVCSGDSETLGYQSAHYVASDEIRVFPGGGYPYFLQQLLPSITVANQGLVAANSYGIAARVSGIGIAAQFGVAAFASGRYPLTQLNEYSPLFTSQGHKQQRGHLGSVAGLLHRDNTQPEDNALTHYYFVPDAGQPTLETTVTPANPRRSYTWFPEPYRRDQPQIFFPGRNNVGNDQQTLDSVKSLLASIDPSTPRIVMGVLASSNESWGNGREAIEQINRQVAALVGAAFFDPNDVLGFNDDGSRRLDGTPNPSWISDGLHPNDAGYQRLANALYARIVAERWYA